MFAKTINTLGKKNRCIIINKIYLEMVDIIYDVPSNIEDGNN